MFDAPAFSRSRTQKPLSSLWKVTRSIEPEISSVEGLRSGMAAFMFGDLFSHGRSAPVAARDSQSLNHVPAPGRVLISEVDMSNP